MTNAAPTIGRSQWLVLTAAFLGWMFDGLEMGLVPLAGRAALTDLLKTNDDDAIASWFANMTALFLVGAAMGGLVFGWLGDRIGRVRAMSASILTYALFTGAGYWVTSAHQLATLRFFAALGMGGEWALGVALVMECWPAAWRPMLAGAIGAASNVGFLLIALVGAAFPVTEDSWRWIMLAGAAPALLTFFIQIFVPESERWKEAVSKSHGSTPVAEVFSPQLRYTTLIAIGLGAVALLGTWGSVQWVPTWVGKQLLADDEPKVRAIAQAQSQIASAAGAIFGCFFGALLGGRIGRRPVYFLLCLASLLICQTMFARYTEFSFELLVVIFAAGFTTAAFYGWLPLYLPELFPTRVRATGQGTAFNLGRLVAALGVLGTGELVRQTGSYAQAGATISLIYMVGMVLIWFAPETRGRPLPE